MTVVISISTSIYPPEHKQNKISISKLFFQKHFGVCRNAVEKCRKLWRDINKTPITLEVRFSTPGYTSVTQFLDFFQVAEGIVWHLISLTTAKKWQENYTVNKTHKQIFSIPERLENISSNWLMFIWNNKGFWKKHTVLFCFFFNQKSSHSP